MKYRLWLCLLVAIGWVYTVPQIYVGQYSSILGSAVHWGIATVIYATCAMSMWLLLINGRPRAKLLALGGLVLWGLAVVGVWKWIYFYPGQIYKTVWFYVGAFSPFFGFGIDWPNVLDVAQFKESATKLILPQLVGGGGIERSEMTEGGKKEGEVAPPKYALARILRRNLSAPEYLLWQRLKLRLPDQPVFRRQYATGPYVLDFYCFKARLAVEADGGFHGLGDRVTADEKRDLWLIQQGIVTYRVPAADVFRDVDGLADGIRLLAMERFPIK